ncbi:hypothetical protein N7U49_21770 [Streptomyces sp. AD2-2]|nr:hypothetical protein N7U49_21770 [Streptomyces sp. AD2-2]
MVVAFCGDPECGEVRALLLIGGDGLVNDRRFAGRFGAQYFVPLVSGPPSPSITSRESDPEVNRGTAGIFDASTTEPAPYFLLIRAMRARVSSLSGILKPYETEKIPHRAKRVAYF